MALSVFEMTRKQVNEEENELMLMVENEYERTVLCWQIVSGYKFEWPANGAKMDPYTALDGHVEWIVYVG